jgi:hypothetical protein
VDVFGRDGNAVYKEAAGLAVAAAGLVGGNTAFVAPEEVDVLPGDSVSKGWGGEEAEEGFGRAAAGEDEGVDATFFNGGVGRNQDFMKGVAGNGIRTREYFYFHVMGFAF